MKRADFSLILKHGRIYGLANILNRLAGLVLLPVYLHVLSPAEFGVLALVTLTTDAIGVVLGLGLGRALLRFYVGATSDDERDRLIASSLLLLLMLGGGFALLALPIAELSCELLFSSDEHVRVFLYANLATVFTVLFNFELSCLVARKASATYLWASLSKTVVMLSVNVILVVYADMGVTGVVLGTLLSSVLIGGVLLIELVHGRKLVVSARSMRQLFVFAAPLVPSVLLDTVVAALDKLFINRLGVAAAVGGYSTGQRVASLLQVFIVQPFMQIWAVRHLEALDHGGDEEQASLCRIFSLFLIVLCCGALCASLFADEIIAIIASSEYRSAAQVIPLLALAEVILLFRSYFELGVFHANATRFLPWVSLLTLVVAVPVYGVLVNQWGVGGAALAYLIVAAIRVGLVAIVASRVSSASHKLGASGCIVTIAAAVVAYLVASAFLPLSETTPVSLALKAGVVLVYFVVMLWTPAVGADGRKEISRLLGTGWSAMRKSNK